MADTCDYGDDPSLNVLLLLTRRFVTILVVCGDEKTRQQIFNCCGLCIAKLFHPPETYHFFNLLECKVCGSLTIGCTGVVRFHQKLIFTT